MRVPKTEVINGVTYTLMQCGAVQGRKAVVRLLKIIGPAYAVLQESQSIEKGLVALVDRMSEEDMDYFCELLAANTMIGGQTLSGVFEEHFVGKYGDLARWLIAALKHNFGSFLDGLGDIALPQEPQAVKATSPK